MSDLNKLTLAEARDRLRTGRCDICGTDRSLPWRD